MVFQAIQKEPGILTSHKSFRRCSQSLAPLYSLPSAPFVAERWSVQRLSNGNAAAR
jgi:hypothetical protein